VLSCRAAHRSWVAEPRSAGRRRPDAVPPSWAESPTTSGRLLEAVLPAGAEPICRRSVSGCPQGITRDARSAPLTVIFCGSILGRREGCPTSSACPVGPGLGHGRPRWSAWLLTAPTLPWPEGPNAAGGARRGTDRRSGPALAAPYGCPGIPTPGSSAVGRLGRHLRRAARALEVVTAFGQRRLSAR
jgi:hypothetical protein